MIKNDVWIQTYSNSFGLIYPFKEVQLSPASYDLTLRDHWIFQKKFKNTIEDVELFEDSFELAPNSTVLASTLEVIKMPPNVIGFLTLKSSLARIFLNHMNSNLINPGFYGSLVLEFQNCSMRPILLSKGMRVSQIIFMEMNDFPWNAYKSGNDFQDQIGTKK